MKTILLKVMIIVLIILGPSFISLMPWDIEICVVYADSNNNATGKGGLITENLYGIIYAGGQFVTVGAKGTVSTSSDGIYWTKQTSGISGGFSEVTYGDLKYVAVGSSIAWSSDGEDWAETTEAGGGFTGVTFGDSQFVAVKYGSVWTSPHGISWTEQSFDPTVYLNAVTWGNPGYVTVGHIGNFNEGQIYYSTNGMNWALVYSDTYMGFNNLRDVIYANSEYSAVGWSGREAYSTDGINWQDKHCYDDPWFDAITYGKSKYVMITDWNYVCSWCYAVKVQFGINTEDIAFGNSLFVIVGSSGNIFSSPDALCWTRRNPYPSSQSIHSGDYDGDGTSEIAVFRVFNGLWAIRGVTRTYFGEAGEYIGYSEDKPATGDYNGDGTTNIGIFRSRTGLWAIKDSSRFYFGNKYDQSVPGDYNGDGTTDGGIFREDSSLWAIRGVTRAYFGGEGDIPVSGDYSGSGRDEIAIFRPNSGLWAIRSISRFYFGGEDDLPVTGDYDGDGTDDYSIFSPSNGFWTIRGLTQIQYGRGGDWAVPADYTGDGTNGIGIFRDITGLWAIRGLSRTYFGTSGDAPVAR